MYRIRMTLPKREAAAYRNLDILHDAVVAGLDKTGADRLVGPDARPFHFAALGWNNRGENRCHTLVIGTPDPVLAASLKKLIPADVAYARAQTSEAVDFARADVVPDPDPIVPGQRAIGVVALSPFVVSRRNGKQRWHDRLDDFDLAEAVNHRLTRIAGRSVSLRIEPDRLYIRAHSRYDTLVRTKEMKNGSRAFVIGMRVPLVFQGCDDDLRLAWYAGIGEKNRNGFGCVGLAERGIGR